MSPTTIYRDAVVDDGKQVLYEVTSRLYKGENLRPDVYCQKVQNLRHYNQIFNQQQRQVIENSGSPEFYNIEEGAHRFDITLHALIAEHMCGLKRSDSLCKSVSKVRQLRNDVCHGYETISETELNTKLEELLHLYRDIIHDIENRTGDNLWFVVMKIEGLIKDRMKSEKPDSLMAWHPSDEDTHYRQPSRPSQSHHSSAMTTSEEESEIPTWGKVAIGVGITGLALYGIGKAISSNSEESDDKRRQNACAKRNQTKNSNDKEECVVM